MSVDRLGYCLDGRWLTPGELAFAPSSRLVAAGEGWFETLRVESGRPMFLSPHLDRLTDAIATYCGADQVEPARYAAQRCLAAMAPKFSEYPSGRLRLVLARDESRLDAHADGWQALGEWSEHRSSAASLEQGVDIGDPAELAGIGRAHGLSAETLAAFADGTGAAGVVEAEEQRLRLLGVSNVPNLLLNGRVLVPGPADVDTYVVALDQAIFPAGPSPRDNPRLLN